MFSIQLQLLEIRFSNKNLLFYTCIILIKNDKIFSNALLLYYKLQFN